MASGAHNTIIGRDTRVRGRVISSGSGAHDVEVQGHVEGELTIEGDVRVDASGTVAADIRARRIVVRGAVKGNLSADEAITLEEGARVVGDLRAPRVSIAVGGLVRGYVETGASGGARTPHKATTHQSHQSHQAHRDSPSRIAKSQSADHAPAKAAPKKEIVHAKSDGKQGAKMTLSGGKAAPRPVVPVLKKGTKAALTKRR